MKTIATVFYTIPILYLFWFDQRKSSGVSDAIWIPFIWFLFATSRPISFWLSYAFSIGSFGGSSAEEGNVIEQIYTIGLMVAGVCALRRREIHWQRLLTDNVWIVVFFVFALFSFAWSDYPFVSLKRLLKTLGTVVMALVILSEERPYEAIGVILRRMAYIHLPLSVLFIKYYPHLGRFYHGHGAEINAGVAGYKNGLGVICLISCIYFAWVLLLDRWRESSCEQHLHYSIYLVVTPMIAWLLYRSHSATAFLCLAVSLCLLILGRQHTFADNPRRLIVLGAALTLSYVVFEFLLDVGINSFIISMLGRRPDLTTRVPMWEELLSMVQNPLLGFGFESFWLGRRADIIEQHWGIDKQAHNGYLDMYLNLGSIGVFLSLAYILAGFKKTYRSLFVDYANAILRLCFLVVFVLFNWTENGFHLQNPMWLLLLLSIMDSLAPDSAESEIPEVSSRVSSAAEQGAT